jgi:hypothetical protein
MISVEISNDLKPPRQGDNLPLDVLLYQSTGRIQHFPSYTERKPTQ